VGDDIYETETSPVSTRFVGATAVVSDDGDDDDDDDGETGAVSEGDVLAFSRKSFGEIVSPYLLPYVHRRSILDAEYGLRKVSNNFLYVITM
jgi:hypothetical protein